MTHHSILRRLWIVLDIMHLIEVSDTKWGSWKYSIQVLIRLFVCFILLLVITWFNNFYKNNNCFCHSVEGGEVVRINFSQPQRGSHFNVPVEQVTPWYRSLELFSKRMHSLHNKVHYKLSEGNNVFSNKFWFGLKIFLKLLKLINMLLN